MPKKNTDIPIKPVMLMIEVPKPHRKGFWTRPRNKLHYWAFKNRPRAFINEKIIFTFDRKPVAQAVVLKIEAPGKQEGEYKHWHKVYWNPNHFQKFRGVTAAVPEDLSEVQRPVSKEYDAVRYVTQWFLDNKVQQMPWSQFQKTFQQFAAKYNALFTQIRKNKPQIMLADLQEWLQEQQYAEQNEGYGVSYERYQDPKTSYRDVEQLVLQINQGANAERIIGGDNALSQYMDLVSQSSRMSGHPAGEKTVGWLRVDFVDQNTLLIDEVQSDLVNSVSQAKLIVETNSYEEFWEALANDRVRELATEKGITAQHYQNAKRGFASYGFTIDVLEDIKRKLIELTKDWAEHAIATVLEIARRNGIKSVAIHTAETIAERDPGVEADKIKMFYDSVAKSFGFKKQPLDIGGRRGNFWVRTAAGGKWFGPVFHGTNASPFQKLKGNPEVAGMTYFTDDPEYARYFANRGFKDKSEGARILPCYIRINKPFDARQDSEMKVTIDEYAKIVGTTRQAMLEEFPTLHSEAYFWRYLLLCPHASKAGLEKQGYDGIIQLEQIDRNMTPDTTSYVVFNNRQIRSALADPKPKKLLDLRTGSVKLYHGTRAKLEIGTILTPQPHGYVNDPEVAQHEQIMENARPEGSLPRNQSVYMVADPDEIDFAGGYEDFVYEVEPIGEVERNNMGWYSEVSMYEWDNIADSRAVEAAESYWLGLDFPKSSIWEYRAPKAKIVRLVSTTHEKTSAQIFPTYEQVMDKSTDVNNEFMIDDELADPERDYQETLAFWQQQKFPLTVYRALALNEGEQPRTEDAGLSWSLDRGTALDIVTDLHPDYDHYPVLEAKVMPNNINWVDTFRCWLTPLSEKEVRMKPGAKLQSKGKKIKADHDLDVGDGEKYWAGEGNAASGILPVCPQTGNVCLAWRSKYVNRGNCWGTIGGAVQTGMSPAQSAKEELKEETGRSVSQLIPAYVFSDRGFTYHNFIGITNTEFSFAPQPYSEERAAEIEEWIAEDPRYEHQRNPGWETDYIQWVPYAEVVEDMKKHSSHYHPGMLKLFSESGALIEKALGLNKTAAKIKTEPMDAEWLQRLDENKDYEGRTDLEELDKRLLSFGGGRTLILSKEVPPNEVQRLLQRGQFWPGSKARMQKMETSRCHGNSYCLMREGLGSVVNGFALSKDGLWRNHSWLVKPDGSLVETTMRRKAYYGAVLTPEEVKAEYSINASKIAGEQGELFPSSQDAKFRQWFQGSKVVDKQGNPLPVYHGTRSSVDFDTFSVDGPPVTDDGEGTMSSGSGADPTAFMGAHFAVEPQVASQFATPARGRWQSTRYEGENEMPRVLKVYLRITNPKDFGNEHNLREFINQGKINGDALDIAMEADGIQPMEPEHEEAAAEWYKKYENDATFRAEQNRYLFERAPGGEGYDDALIEAAQELASQARGRLETAGHDGVHYKNVVEGGTAWIAFAPNQIKSAWAQEFNPQKEQFTASWIKEAAQHKWYHITSIWNRESIQKSGLLPKIENFKNITRKPGVYLFPDEGQAINWAFDHWHSFLDMAGADVWEVNVSEDMLQSDIHPETEGAMYSTKPIKPSKLRLVETVWNDGESQDGGAPIPSKTEDFGVIESSWVKNAAGFAFKSFPKLWHVGSMNPADKRPGSYEGAGLSVSVHPEDWQQIAEIGGDLWEFTKKGNKFVNFHRMTKAQRETIAQWGVQNGYVEHVEVWRATWFDDEREENVYADFLTKEEALAESPKVKLVKNQLQGTEKLKQRTRNPHTDTQVAFDLLVTVYAEEQLDCDGVWWEDNYDPENLSAPRGVIFPNKLSTWSKKKVDWEGYDTNEEDDEVEALEAEIKKHGDPDGVLTQHLNAIRQGSDLSYYMTEGCAIFAVALCQLHPKSEIGVIVDREGEPWNENIPYEMSHVYCSTPSANYDVKGQRSVEQMAADFHIGHYTVMGGWGWKEFMQKFMGLGDVPLYGERADVDEAKQIILANPEKYGVPKTAAVVKPTATQLDGLKHMASGKPLYRIKGGFWTTEPVASYDQWGVPLDEQGNTIWYIPTRTMGVMAHRGWITRTNKYPEHWRDERIITDAGLLLVMNKQAGRLTPSIVHRGPQGFNVEFHDNEGVRVGHLQIDIHGESATVKAIDVDENHQRQGIATKLYQAARIELKKRGVKVLKGALEGSGPVQIREKVFGPGSTKYYHGGEEINTDQAIKVMDVDYGYTRAETSIASEK
jgi:8-oxo-dGTP pyrophosphatase MutT (NUDIX family)/GNAT superfamily N-acetyltransferase